MSDAPGDRPDPLRAWLEATGGDQTQRPPVTGDGRREDGPSRRLTAATAVVCATAVVLAVAVRVKDAGGHTPDVSPAPPTVSATMGATPAPAAPAQDHDLVSNDPAVEAAALLAVRTGAGDDVYVDTAAVESLGGVGATTVVTVRALMLRRVRGGWSPPQTVRFAVPVGSSGSEQVALAAPWRLPSPVPTAPRPAWEPVDDADMTQSATQAVGAAGYSGVADVRVRRAREHPGVLAVALRAVAPGDDAARDHELWLTEDAGAVLGMPAMTDIPIPGGQP